MKSKTTRKFRQLLADLPPNIRDSADAAYLLFAANPAHPSLRFKKVHTTEPIYSARVNLDYRAVGLVIDDMIVWFWIGKHGDYEKLLNNL